METDFGVELKNLIDFCLQVEGFKKHKGLNNLKLLLDEKDEITKVFNMKGFDDEVRLFFEKNKDELYKDDFIFLTTSGCKLFNKDNCYLPLSDIYSELKIYAADENATLYLQNYILKMLYSVTNDKKLDELSKNYELGDIVDTKPQLSDIVESKDQRKDILSSLQAMKSKVEQLANRDKKGHKKKGEDDVIVDILSTPDIQKDIASVIGKLSQAQNQSEDGSNSILDSLVRSANSSLKKKKVKVFK